MLGLVLGTSAGVVLAWPGHGAPHRRASVSSARNAAGQADPYDEQFIDRMVVHHEMAIMSARMMIGGSSHAELRDLARRIENVQQQQIDQMRAWRRQWYGSADVPGAGGPMGEMMAMLMGGCGTGNGMREIMGSQMMGGMMGGGNADELFLRMMIPHHQAAIAMSRAALQNADHAEIKALAQQIIDGQSAEIVEMQGYLQAWFGEAPPACAAGS